MAPVGAAAQVSNGVTGISGDIVTYRFYLTLNREVEDLAVTDSISPGEVTPSGNAVVTGVQMTASATSIYDDGTDYYQVWADFDVRVFGTGEVTLHVADTAYAVDGNAVRFVNSSFDITIGEDELSAVPVLVATGLIGAMQELRSKLILEHGPDVRRRLNRLKGNYANTGGVSGFGLAWRNDDLPFAITLGRDSASFAYSLRNSRATSGRQGPSGITGAVADRSNRLVSANTNALAYSGALSAAEKRVLGMKSDDVGFAPGGPERDVPAGGVSPLAMFDGENGQKSDADPMNQRYDIWLEGRVSKFDASAGDGTFAILHAGADYLVTKDLLVGLGTQFDWIDMDAASGAGTVGGHGFMVGPYMTAKLVDGLYFDARGAWGQAWNQVSPFGTYEDDFNSERWLATAALIGEFTAGYLTVSPEARLSWFKETSETYVDSLMNQIPSVMVETGAFEFGPTISRKIAMEGGTVVVPFTTLTGIWTFQQTNTAAAVATRLGLADEGVRGRVEAGFDVANDNGLSLSVSGHYDGIGDKGFEAYGGKARFARKF